MIDLALMVAAAAQTADSQPQKKDTIFACQFFRSEREASDGWVHIVDVRMVERTGGVWTIQRARSSVVTATSFEAKPGSVENVVGLRWRENGRRRTAYLSFANLPLPDGIRVFRMNFDRPPPWKAPGYICQSDGNSTGTAK